MKQMIRYGFVLALICVIAAGLLAAVNLLTRNKILTQAQAEEEASLKDVFPTAANFKAVKSGNEIIYYSAYDQKQKFLGVVFKTAAKGYSSTIETIAGMLKNGTVTAIKVLSQAETPGLGSQVVTGKFTQQFKDKNADDLSKIEAISGATISSQAVIKSVAKKAAEIKKIMPNE